MDLSRSNNKKAPIQRVQLHQNTQRQTYDHLEDARLYKTLSEFENKSWGNPKNAWNLIKELSGKKKSVTFIQGENHLKIWKDHFQNLLSVNKNDDQVQFDYVKLFDINPEISTAEFSQKEITDSLKAIKPNKAPGLDGLTLEVWKLEKTQKYLRGFCNETFNGGRPNEWGISGIVPVPKKGDLTLCTNYRGKSLSHIASKIYNRLILNRIRPVIDRLLRPSQNGFRPGRSTSSHLLALRRIIEKLRNHKKEAVITFIDFKKTFDSIDWSKMLKILVAYVIPSEFINAIRVMYENTSALVVTSEGNTDIFQVDTGIYKRTHSLRFFS